MKKTKIILPALAVILVIGLMVGPALAYFTAHTEAKGSAKINLGFETEIKEEIVDMQKIVNISNKGPESVWVRAKAFSAYDLNYTSSTDWEIGPDNYYYLKVPLNAKESTAASGDDDSYTYLDKPLVIGIETTVTVDGTTIAQAPEDFNVVVVYECAPVQYDANGNPSPAAATDPANWKIEPVTEAETTEGGGN